MIFILHNKKNYKQIKTKIKIKSKNSKQIKTKLKKCLKDLKLK